MTVISSPLYLPSIYQVMSQYSWAMCLAFLLDPGLSNSCVATCSLIVLYQGHTCEGSCSEPAIYSGTEGQEHPWLCLTWTPRGKIQDHWALFKHFRMGPSSCVIFFQLYISHPKCMFCIRSKTVKTHSFYFCVLIYIEVHWSNTQLQIDYQWKH